CIAADVEHGRLRGQPEPSLRLLLPRGIERDVAVCLGAVRYDDDTRRIDLVHPDELVTILRADSEYQVGAVHRSSLHALDPSGPPMTCTRAVVGLRDRGEPLRLDVVRREHERRGTLVPSAVGELPGKLHEDDVGPGKEGAQPI